MTQNSWLFSALFLLHAYGDHEVVCGCGAYVFQAVHHVGRGEDYAARADRLRFSVVDEFEVALANEQELGVAVLVRRVWHLACRERRLVDLDELAGGQGSREDLTACASVGVLLDGKLVVVEDDGLRELAIRPGGCASLRLGHHTAHSREGGERYTEFTTVDIFHADILRAANNIGHLFIRWTDMRSR